MSIKYKTGNFKEYDREMLGEFLDYLMNNEIADIGRLQIDLFLDWKYDDD